MNTKPLIEDLKKNKTIFQGYLENVAADLYLWKPEPAKWCLLEIACHLYDEEREDFRARVKHILENPGVPLPSIDPVAWVTARKYVEQDYKTVLNNFLDERDRSVQWLQQLSNPKWDNLYKHPKLGDITAKMIFVNWIAHDFLHFRQITKLKYDYLKKTTNEDLLYAGQW
jgi:hypothetical protein